VLGLGRAQRFWQGETSMQQLGGWVSSEEEPKPKRGSREQSHCFSGAWTVKTLEPNLRVKGTRGAPKQ